MKEAFLISGAILMLTAWTTDSPHDDDVAIASLLAIIFFTVSMVLWIMEAF